MRTFEIEIEETDVGNGVAYLPYLTIYDNGKKVNGVLMRALASAEARGAKWVELGWPGFWYSHQQASTASTLIDNGDWSFAL